MANSTMQVELVSLERMLYSGEAEMLVARTVEGEIGILPHHAPLIGVLKIGELRMILPGGQEVVAAVHGGFMGVRDNRVIVLADAAELADQIDVERARHALERAEAKLTHAEDAETQAALARAHLRLHLRPGIRGT
ncbi:MAG: ATP synthase F1 subunit epsilon [Actinomycetota bacterium]